MNDIETDAGPRLSEDQERALVALEDAVRDGDRTEFTLGGLAGTGKSFVLKHFVERRAARGLTINVCAPTARACVVLRKRMIANASTIHALIYTFRGVVVATDEDGRDKEELDFEYVGREHDENDRPVVAVDEASMVSGDVARDLRRHALFIAWFGDHGQLPPVGDDPRIMSNLDARLERIHRQGEGSSIIDLAHRVRTGVPLSVAVGEIKDPQEVTIADGYSEYGIAEMALKERFEIVLVARNDTRAGVNLSMRRLLGYKPTDLIVPGEKLVGLRNNHGAQVVNGELYEVLRIEREDDFAIQVQAIDSLGATVNTRVVKKVLGAGKPSLSEMDELGQFDRSLCFLDYAYALTTHKAQGGEWDRVLVLDERIRHKGWDYPRWAYTAATRAKKHLRIVRDGRR